MIAPIDLLLHPKDTKVQKCYAPLTQGGAYRCK